MAAFRVDWFVGMTTQAMADKYGFSQSHISRIARNSGWPMRQKATTARIASYSTRSTEAGSNRLKGGQWMLDPIRRIQVYVRG